LADPASVSIVIPAFNESASIAEVVSVLRTAASWREIIVVDDGSSDATAERAASAGASVVRLPYNMGNGAAVKNGIRRATGEFILIVDADGQHPPEDADRLAPG
jgi:glycosyltransferase involved in cell wall biosynthesis